MNALLKLLPAALLCALSTTAHAGVEIKLSVKFIHNWNGAAPTNVNPTDVSTPAAFDVEVARANSILDATGRAYKLRVIEYLDIQPSAPSDQSADFWYNLDAREYGQLIEDTALASPAVWKWHGGGALNFYINNSSSGSCARDSISLGSTIGVGTVLHEVGHFLNLSHTHDGDPDFDGWSAPDPLSSGLSDGDNLPETIWDHPFYTIEQLAFANFGRNYSDPLLPPAQRQLVDDVFYNVMSYHNEDRLLPIQMDYWTINANVSRQVVCTGRTWFVKPDGLDIFHDGLSPGTAFQTFDRGLEELTNPDYVHLGDDVLLLRGGSYTTSVTVVDIPCTITASNGPVTITKP